MNQRYIMPVNDNYDKQQTYAELISRYNKAVKNDFYFEALLIDYAIMEDRLRSYMYYIGALFDRKSYKANKGKAIPFLKDIVLEYKESGEPDGLSISSVSGKRKIIKAVLRWASSVSGITAEQKYLYALKSQCEGLDIQELLKVLDQLGEWCSYRNEIIHALMNKNISSINEQLQDKVQEGMEISRYLDAQLRIFKKGDKVRRAANLPKE